MWLRISSPLSQDNREIDWGWQITQPQQQFFFENRWLLQWTPLNVEIYVHTQSLYYIVIFVFCSLRYYNVKEYILLESAGCIYALWCIERWPS